MATNSAGVNFGKPNEEFIIESDGSGALTSARNAVTGEEFIGGGGTYSTVHVTFVFTDVGNGRPVIVYGISDLFGDIPFSSNEQYDRMDLTFTKIFDPTTTTPVIDMPFISGKSINLNIFDLNGSTDIGGEFFIDRETPVISVSGDGTVVDLSQGLIEITGDCTIYANTLYD